MPRTSWSQLLQVDPEQFQDKQGQFDTPNFDVISPKHFLTFHALKTDKMPTDWLRHADERTLAQYKLQKVKELEQAFTNYQNIKPKDGQAHFQNALKKKLEITEGELKQLLSADKNVPNNALHVPDNTLDGIAPNRKPEENFKNFWQTLQKLIAQKYETLLAELYQPTNKSLSDLTVLIEKTFSVKQDDKQDDIAHLHLHAQAIQKWLLANQALIFYSDAFRDLFIHLREYAHTAEHVFFMHQMLTLPHNDKRLKKDEKEALKKDMELEFARAKKQWEQKLSEVVANFQQVQDQKQMVTKEQEILIAAMKAQKEVFLNFWQTSTNTNQPFDDHALKAFNANVELVAAHIATTKVGGIKKSLTKEHDGLKANIISAEVQFKNLRLNSQESKQQFGALQSIQHPTISKHTQAYNPKTGTMCDVYMTRDGHIAIKANLDRYFERPSGLEWLSKAHLKSYFVNGVIKRGKFDEDIAFALAALEHYTHGEMLTNAKLLMTSESSATVKAINERLSNWSQIKREREEEMYQTGTKEAEKSLKQEEKEVLQKLRK